LAPKACGHTQNRRVVGRGEAVGRIRAAVDARDEGAGILINARSDARAALGLDEALWRAQVRVPPPLRVSKRSYLHWGSKRRCGGHRCVSHLPSE
jgi:hypothetical protein